MIIPITRKSKNFYSHLGYFFGSRKIENETKDRFYDDEEKIWYCYFKGNKITALVSIKNNIMKNVYCTNKEHLEEVLEKIYPNVKKSIVTKIYKEIYLKCNYKILEEKENFLVLVGGFDEKNVE